MLAAGGDCTSDGQCDGGQDGRCVFSPGRGDNICSYDECFSDSDCTDGGPCTCRDDFTFGGNACLPSNCRLDQDCGTCGYCSPSIEGCAPLVGVVGYYCHTPDDKCVDDSDCTSTPGLSCVWSPLDAHWICSVVDCTG